MQLRLPILAFLTLCRSIRGEDPGRKSSESWWESLLRVLLCMNNSEWADLAKYTSLTVHSLGWDQEGKWAQAVVVLKKLANRDFSPVSGSQELIDLSISDWCPVWPIWVVLGRTGLMPQAYGEVTTGKQAFTYLTIFCCWLCLCLLFALGKCLFVEHPVNLISFTYTRD